MVLVTPKEFEFKEKVTYNSIEDIVHYDLFEFKAKKLQESYELINRIESGKLGILTYSKYLAKSILDRLL